MHAAHAVRHAGELALAAGETAAAGDHFRTALDHYRLDPETKPLDLANALRGAALHAVAIDDTTRAEALWREARGIYADLSIAAGVAEADAALAALGLGS